MTSTSRHTFVLNKIPTKDGVAVETTTLCTQFTSEHGKISYYQEVILEGYCNSITFLLRGKVFTPERLRQLANELETEISKLENKS